MEDPFGYATLGCGVFYRDPVAALAWLEAAFGFRRSLLVRDEAGRLAHAEMRFADAYIIIDAEWAGHVASPLSVGGKNTRSVYLRLSEGLDAHCEVARRAGARILQEPADQIHGDRTYRALDPEGHVWTFAQTVRHVSREEAERLGGFQIEGWHEAGK